MQIMEQISRAECWEEFLKYKKQKIEIQTKELEDLERFISEKEYIDAVHTLLEKEEFPIPKLVEINKKATGKKRKVFLFSREYNYILKLISYLLKRYDGLFCENLYSFRNETGVKKAIFNLQKTVEFDQIYSYKVDIQNYFNSIPTEQILLEMKKALEGEPQLLAVLTKMLENKYAWKDGKVVEIKKGIMAGVPIF